MGTNPVVNNEVTHMPPVVDLEAIHAQFKKGIHTTEFWLGVLPLTLPAIAWAARMFGVDVDEEVLLYSLTGLIPQLFYIFSRGKVKAARNATVATAIAANAAIVSADKSA